MEKRRVTSIQFFPDEIMFSIFLFVPACILHNVIRYVCRQWYSIIQDPIFVSTHFLHSTDTPLVNPTRSSHARFLDVNESGINLMEFKLQFPSKVLCSCNGLILIEAFKTPRLHNSHLIANPATNRILALPPLEFSVPYENFCRLAFAVSSKVYKVVMVYRSKMRLRFGCAIFTVGEDNAWRLINCADLNLATMKFFLFRKPITSTRFLYWYYRGYPKILTLDVEAERFKLILCPQADNENKGLYYLLPKGNSISLFHVNNMNKSMEVWVLKDHETEEWMKFPSFKIEVPRLGGEMNRRYRASRNYLCPVCWLRKDERILFHVESVEDLLFVYDVKMRSGFTFAFEGDFRNIIPYVNSLAWL